MRVLARHVMKSKAQWDAELRDAEDRKAADQVEQERRMREVAALADPVDLAIEVLDLGTSEVSRAGKSLVSALNDLIENATRRATASRTPSTRTRTATTRCPR
jgi:hypothetical protein